MDSFEVLNTTQRCFSIRTTTIMMSRDDIPQNHQVKPRNYLLPRILIYRIRDYGYENSSGLRTETQNQYTDTGGKDANT
jgi:hypothetical protein